MSDYDMIIRGGDVIDGTMLPRYKADVAIKGGKVVKIGGIPAKATADRVIDAEGCIVAPGYIDIHTHYDAQILWDPYCTISGWHGVTSVVLGNCGFGFAPVKPAHRDRAMMSMTRNEAIEFDVMKEGMKWDEGGWETLPEWMDHLDRIPKGVNCSMLVPLNPLYAYVMGSPEEAKRRRPTAEEMTEMKRIINDAMDRGACGISYQRAGVPSVQPDYDGSPMITDLLPDSEIIELGRVLGERGEGFIEMFDSSPSDHATVEDFMTSLAEASGRPIVRNILLANEEKPEGHRRFLKWLDESHAKGLQVYGMAFTVRAPTIFTFQDWSLWDGMPAWHEVMNGSYEERVAKMKNEDIRKELRREIHQIAGPGTSGPPKDLIVHATGGFPELDKYVGRCVSEIAMAEGKELADVLVDISLASEFKAEFVGDAYGASAKLTGEVLRSSYAVPGISDGGAHCHFIVQGAYPTDLLEWMVREEGQITAEQAHYGLSRLPAHMCGMHDRGVIRVGAPADIVVYDPKKIRRTPSWNKAEKLYDQPAGGWRRAQRAEGLHFTICNGVITFEDQECTGATPGQFIRQGAMAA